MDIHPSDKLVLYMSGELIPDELEAVDAHLRGCNSCLSELDELKAGDSLLSLYGRIVNSKEVCPMPEELSQFVDDTNINDGKRDGIKHHIAQCSDCRKQIELLMQLNKDMLTIVTEESSNIVPLLPDYLRSSLRGKYPKVFKKRFFPAIHAATILIVIGFFLWFFKYNPVTEYQITEKAPITFAPGAPTNIAPTAGETIGQKVPQYFDNDNESVKVSESAKKSSKIPVISYQKSKEEIKTYSAKPKVSEFKEAQMKNLAENRNTQNYQAPAPLEEGGTFFSSTKRDDLSDEIQNEKISLKKQERLLASEPNKSVGKQKENEITLNNLEDELRNKFALKDLKLQIISGKRSGYDKVDYRAKQNDGVYSSHKKVGGVYNSRKVDGVSNSQKVDGGGSNSKEVYGVHSRVDKDANVIGREVVVSTTALLSQEKQELIRQYLIVNLPLNPEVDLVRFVVRQIPQIP